MIEEYQIHFSESFMLSVEENIINWQDLGLREAQINDFIKTINIAIKSLKLYPSRFADVSSVYDFKIPTRRILIGKKYSIFFTELITNINL